MESTSVDKRVGSRIRLRRKLLGYSQEKLALALGVSFQQVQKYEKGSNRVGASRLFDIAQILQVPINFFFDDESNSIYITKTTVTSDSFATIAHDIQEKLDDSVNDVSLYEGECHLLKEKNKEESINLLKAYYAIKSPEIRRKLLNLMRVMGDNS